ncbi:hypothetical protein C8R44DRAFT_755325 [Mycena epipterygia]|nr:hypothetical protein C8R44DRAFT_755325 [Mycena epipterygia]
MTLLAENRKLKQQNAELLAFSSKKSRRGGGEEERFGYRSHILGFAKHFLLTRALWVDTTQFGPKPPELSPNPQDWFSSDEAYAQNTTAALYQDIPEQFHTLLDSQTYSSFAKDFVREHGDGRSSLINVIRKSLPVLLNDLKIDAALLITASADRSNNIVLKGLLQFPNDRKATPYAPVLFPGTRQNMKECFTGPVVMKSLVPNIRPAQNTNGMKLGIKKVTEASIAAAAILTRFVLSSNKEWASKGAISGIEWEAEYRAYHKMLMCNRDQPHVKKILNKIHAFVFAGVTLPSTDANNANGDSDGETEDAIADAMRRFELGTDPTSDPEEDDGSTPHNEADPGPVAEPEDEPEPIRLAAGLPVEEQVNTGPSHPPNRNTVSAGVRGNQGAASGSNMGRVPRRGRSRG